MLHDLIETHRIVGVTQMKIEKVLIIHWFSIKGEYFLDVIASPSTYPCQDICCWGSW